MCVEKSGLEGDKAIKKRGRRFKRGRKRIFTQGGKGKLALRRKARIPMKLVDFLGKEVENSTKQKKPRDGRA